MGRGSIAKNISFFKSVETALDNGQFDITYGLSRVAPVDFLRISDPLHSAWLDLGYRRRWPRRIMPRHRMLLMLEKKAIKGTGAFVVNSKLVRDQLMSYYDVDRGRIRVLYNGVDRKRFSPLKNKDNREFRRSFGISEDDMVLLFAGSDLKRKGFYPLSEAFVSVCKEVGNRVAGKVFLLIAGREGDRKAERLFRDANVSGQVLWLGYRNDMERLYGIADLFVLPTRYDPFANSVLESMSCGTPAVTTASNGASELFRDSLPELVCSLPDAEEIAGAVLHYISLEPEAREDVARTVVNIAGRYGWESHVDMIEEMFALHLESRRRQR
jgi:UDP-glucose:(heptosyl)LPS alpha-1,3-glucosyltransferase